MSNNSPQVPVRRRRAQSVGFQGQQTRRVSHQPRLSLVESNVSSEYISFSQLHYRPLKQKQAEN